MCRADNTMDNYFYTGGGANRSQEDIEILKHKEDQFDQSLISELFKKELGEDVVDVKYSSSKALTHLVFFVKVKSGKEFVLRANIGLGGPEIQLVIEKLATDLAIKAGVPSCKIVSVDVSRAKYPFDFQIQEKVEGIDPEVEFNGTKEQYDKLSFEIGQSIAKLSTVEIDGFGRFDESEAMKGRLKGVNSSIAQYLSVNLENELNNICGLGIFSTKLADSVKNVFEKRKSLFTCTKGCLTHYDIADHNLKYDPATFSLTGLLDWEAAVSCDPLMDIASCPTWKTLYERESHVIAGFKSLKALPDNFQEKIDLFRLRTIIWKTDHNVRFGIHSESKLARIESALKPFGLGL